MRSIPNVSPAKSTLSVGSTGSTRAWRRAEAHRHQGLQCHQAGRVRRRPSPGPAPAATVGTPARWQIRPITPLDTIPSVTARPVARADVHTPDDEDQVSGLAHLVVDERGPHRHRPLGEVDDAGALVDDDQSESERGVHGAEAEPDDEEQEVDAHRRSQVSVSTALDQPSSSMYGEVSMKSGVIAFCDAVVLHLVQQHLVAARRLRRPGAVVARDRRAHEAVEADRAR